MNSPLQPPKPVVQTTTEAANCTTLFFTGPGQNVSFPRPPNVPRFDLDGHPSTVDDGQAAAPGGESLD